MPRGRPASEKSIASMGPASENAGYGDKAALASTERCGFNGSGVRERRLWLRPRKCRRRGAPLCFNGSGVRERRLCDCRSKQPDTHVASMGPASENAGYVRVDDIDGREHAVLASMGPASENAGYALTAGAAPLRSSASMGPASENAGYASPVRSVLVGALILASMGLASENAGYAAAAIEVRWPRSLQWVRRPRTPVMRLGRERIISRCTACFNGSGVRERRLCAVDRTLLQNPQLQWVRRPRTPVMRVHLGKV